MSLSPDPADPRAIPQGADPTAANADSVTPIRPPLNSVPTTRSVLTAGLVSGLSASLVCLLLRAIAAVFRVDFTVALRSDQVSALPWIAIVLVPLVAGVGGAAVAAVFLGVRNNQRWVFWLGTLVLVLTAVLMLSQPSGVTWPTRIWLVLMALATWTLVVPQVARVVGDSDPRVTAAYRDVIR